MRSCAIVGVGLAALLAGCKTSGDSAASQPAASTLVLPEPADELKPLAFLAGGWAMQQPKGAIIEEHWSAPRAKSMMAMFRRIRGDQVTPFYEFTQIVVEPDGVMLRQRHIHGQFEADPRNTEAMVLKLERADGASATFLPVANAGTLARVTYTLSGPNTLVLKVEPKPESKEPVLEFPMTRIRTGN